MPLELLPRELIALITTWLPDEPGSNLVRRLASSIMIKEIRNGLTYANGLLHNYDGVPLITNKIQLWCYYNKPHRENGPSVITANGMFWFYHGLLHNETGPAAIIGKSKLWYKFGLLHSYNGNYAIIHANGDCEYYNNNLLHRDGAPAICERNGINYYYKSGVFIKKDNPMNIKSWYQKGIARFTDDAIVYNILLLGKFVICK